MILGRFWGLAATVLRSHLRHGSGYCPRYLQVDCRQRRGLTPIGGMWATPAAATLDVY